MFHEIGHVQDWERGVNLREGDVRIVDAEVYANEFSLTKLMEGDYRISLSAFLASIEELQEGADHERQIGQRLIATKLFEQSKECVSRNWHDYLDCEDVE